MVGRLHIMAGPRTNIWRCCRDFNAPLVPPRPADSSAAMIAANGLLLLADQELSILNATGAAYYTAEVVKVRVIPYTPERRADESSPTADS